MASIISFVGSVTVSLLKSIIVMEAFFNVLSSHH